MNVAFLIIDLQNCFIDTYREKADIPDALEHINYVSELFRKAKQPVFIVQDIESAEEYSKEELDFIPELKIEKTDIHIKKMESNSFWNTDLDAHLKSLNTQMVVVAGNAAEYCVLFTYNGAVERGYKAVMLQNGILSSDYDNIINSFKNRNFISYPVIEYLLS